MSTFSLTAFCLLSCLFSFVKFASLFSERPFVSLKAENTQFPSEHDSNAETKSFRFKDRNRGIFVPFCLRLLLNTLLELILLNVTSNHNTQQRLYDIVKQYLRTAPFLLPVCVCFLNQCCINH